MAIVNTIDISAITEDPRGLTFDGKNLWMTDETGIRCIDRTANLILSIAQTDLQGITTDGKYLWVTYYVADPAAAQIRQYDKFGSLINTIDVSATDAQPRGITTDGKYLWWIGWQNRNIYCMDKFGNLISSFAGTTYFWGITTDGKYLWITGGDAPPGRSVFQFDKFGNEIQRTSVAATDPEPKGITAFDEKYLWWVGKDFFILVQMTKI